MTERTLMIAGAVLVFLGLLSGLVGGVVETPRLALAAHLTGVTNGILLIALGAIWHRVALGPREGAVAILLLIYGTFANWASIQLAALWGAGRLLPMANPAPSASDWQEAVVGFGLLTLTAAMLVGMALVIWGLWRSAPA